MKTRIAILLVASAIMVSFGATRINKAPEPIKKAELQATASKAPAPIGGLGLEDH